jgi:hypothetical protein
MSASIPGKADRVKGLGTKAFAMENRMSIKYTPWGGGKRERERERERERGREGGGREGEREGVRVIARQWAGLLSVACSLGSVKAWWYC